MPHFLGYRCSLCQAEYLPDQVRYTCPKDGGNLDVILDYAALRARYRAEDILSRAEPSIWRYLPLLPLGNPPGGEGTPFHVVGHTPIFTLPRLAEKLGLKTLWLKDESRNPTASFKDRASALVVARAREIGADVVVTASTGNAGAALAGMAAATGVQAVIFAPRTAPPAKIAQLLIFGARVFLVDGTYDDAFDLTIQAANEFGWYCRNTGYNPFTAEGKKTAAFEIWEWWRGAHNAWHLLIGEGAEHAPLTIFVSVGDGNIISGLHKGFKDLQELGWLTRMPRLIGVQARGSAAIAQAFHARTEHLTPVKAETIADSISVDLPRDGVRALRAARETGGTYLTVSDEEILAAIAELGKFGVFAEPAGAAAYAGLIVARRQGIIQAEDPVLVLNTGSGLKDVRAAMQAVPEAPIIEPSLDAVRRLLR
uniref:Threonine synthase n=1 Tax=uncultured Chloroflexota bacterium TaxID=166587 RepID=H5SKA1_9CHLR|nr:threonine synthase [uncultured bacterium]BAL56587.1 threonine synthase [uncultured Chloroflexota bacterium]